MECVWDTSVGREIFLGLLFLLLSFSLHSLDRVEDFADRTLIHRWSWLPGPKEFGRTRCLRHRSSALPRSGARRRIRGTGGIESWGSCIRLEFGGLDVEFEGDGRRRRVYGRALRTCQTRLISSRTLRWRSGIGDWNWCGDIGR